MKTLLLMTMALVSAGRARASGIIVSMPSGRPVASASLDDALVQARAIHASAPGATVTITLPPGTTRLRAPVMLTQADSDDVIRGSPNGSTILSGAAVIAVPLSGASMTTDISAWIGRNFTFTGFAYNAPGGASNPVLFQGNRRIEYSAWPHGGYAAGWAIKPVTGGVLFTHAGGRLPPLPGAVLVSGYFVADWAFRAVRGVPQANGIFVPGYTPEFPSKSRVRLRIVNVGGPLSPGTMTLDEASGKVMLRPFNGDDPIEIASALSLLVINGTHNLSIERIRFEKTIGPAVSIERAQHVTLSDCSVGLTVREAIRISGSRDITVQRCVVSDTGAGGIVADGGNRTTLAAGNIVITDSVIERFGLDVRTYAPGVVLTGVGNRLDHSLVAIGPHNGVMLGGNDEVVDSDEITALACETEDVGAIYMGRDWTQRGMRITGNYIHDLGGDQPIGVYLDDQFSGATINDNVFDGMGWGVLLGGGRDNRIDNNVFARMRAAIHYDARGLGNQRGEAVSGGLLMTKLARSPYLSPAWRARYPTLVTLPHDHPGAPLGNEASGNVAFEIPFVQGSDDGFPISGSGTQPAETHFSTAELVDSSPARNYLILLQTAGRGGTMPGPHGHLLFGRYRAPAISCMAARPGG